MSRKQYLSMISELERVGLPNGMDIASRMRELLPFLEAQGLLVADDEDVS
jgi:hypothetical protein